MIKKTIYLSSLLVFMTSCGSKKESGANQNQSELKSQEAIAVKEVNQGSIIGKWEIYDDGILTNKKLAGKIIEFVKDSIYYYDEDGNSVHRLMTFKKNAQLKEQNITVQYIEKGDDGSTIKIGEYVQMNFHEMDPEKLMYTEKGSTISMKMVK